jgi:hypothetical protein
MSIVCSVDCVLYNGRTEWWMRRGKDGYKIISLEPDDLIMLIIILIL